MLTLLLLCLSPVTSIDCYATNAGQLDPTLLLQLRNISEPEYSKERNALLFVVSESAELPGGLQSIWMLDLNTDEARKLTVKGKVNGHPRWCPESSCLTFISDRDGKRAIYRLSMAGGEAEKVTTSKTDILTYAWSPSNDALAYVADAGTDQQPDPTGIDKESLNSTTDEMITVVKPAQQNLWLLDVASGEVEQLTKGDWRISSFEWTPDGKSIVLSANADAVNEVEHDRLFTLGLVDGEVHELWRPNLEIDHFKVSPGGDFVSAIVAREQGPEPFDLVVIRASDGHLSNLTESVIDRKIMTYEWQDKDTMLAVIADGFQSVLYQVSLDKTVRRIADPPVSPGNEIVVSNDFFAFAGGTFARPSELWISSTTGQYRQATTLNADLEILKSLPAAKIIQYKSFDGVTIEAALYLPGGNENNSPFPLVMHIHGGPSARWSNKFRPSWAALLASRGFAVLEPNIRGSTGGSYDFLVMNRNDLGGADFLDVMAGVDHLVAEGLADPNRLGIAGWSYGGYMAAWAVTQTDRFKAAVSGAPVTNWISEYGTESPPVNRYDRALLGDLYDNIDLFTRISPITHVRNATTPTQLLCADKDKIDPVGQCWEFYRGLKQNNVTSELILYKGVGHSRFTWSKEQQVDSMQRMLNWLQGNLMSLENN